MWSDNDTAEDLIGFRVHAELIRDVVGDDTVLPVTIGVDHHLLIIYRQHAAT
ncbi:MAG: hypothetical protein ACLQU4_15745 [Limisphaerales bacterium]